jgi:hypothetical protein
MALQWREGSTGEPALGRSVTLDVAGLEPGRYLIAVSMRAGDGPVRCTSREILLVGS